MGKFGKEIQSNQIPGWSQYYLDYKGLKKIVSSLEASYSTSPDAPTTPLRPSDVLNSPTNVSRSPAQAPPSTNSAGPEDDRGPVFQSHKASFFFKLERELEKINTFYLQKEAELKTRLATLLSKRQAAARRIQVSTSEETNNTGAEWRAVEEGFRLLDQDLGKLQQFIEINATGFRKILKKWDKRSKSRTKELYLARQVEIQPCFNRQLLSELSDTVTTCLLDLSNPAAVMAVDLQQPPATSPDQGVPGTTLSQILGQQQSTPQSSAFQELEIGLNKAISTRDESGVRQALVLVEHLLASGQPDIATHVTRILWKAAIEAEAPIADIIMASRGYDIHYVDDINGRTCLHGAAIAGELRLLNICVENGLVVDQPDFYGRSPLHYGSINGHDEICRRLLQLGADPRMLDKDNYNPLIYAIANRKVACVRVLLDDSRVGVETVQGSPDLNPLLLACQFGPADVPALLLRRGARMVSNSNGQFPLHLAARDGHADICQLLLKEAKGAGKDQPDKYSEWTPLFHAARQGHLSAVQVLLEAGCDPHRADDVGMTAAFYAAWYGYIPCMEALLQAMAASSSTTNTKPSRRSTSISPHSDILPPPTEDVDMIPSLSLPPPIMPLRIYGHTYLDKMHLVQIVLETSCTTSSAISSATSRALLSPRELIGAPTMGGLEPSLKLVVTPKPDSTAAPHTLTLPLAGDMETLSFQVRSSKDLTLEFTFYPTFGSKPIGKAVALPGSLCDEEDIAENDGCKRIILPILDHRLHVIGQITFAACVVTPFQGAKLEVGGPVETYWKSTATGPSATPIARLPSRLLFGHAPSRSVSSAANSAITASPVVRASTSSSSVLPPAVSNVVFSSLSGEYIHAVVQVTRDNVPVVCSAYKLPVEDLDLGVADLTIEQFLALAKTRRTELPPGVAGKELSSSEWRKLLRQTTMTLESLLKVLPLKYGLCLELAFPARFIRRHFAIGRGHQVNEFVDAVLQVAFGGSTSATASIKSQVSSVKRKVVFASFEPSVCVAVNWKQPNFFFASNCGLESSTGLDTADTPNRSMEDAHCASLDAAIAFAKANNLLGVMVAASLLVRVPSLVVAVKDSGVLVAAFGSKDQTSLLTSSTPPIVDGVVSSTVDAVLQDGILSYIDHAPRTVA
ncbi:ubiquitin-protein ligase peroxin 12 [Tulasnella sp. 408]|nr:ubiquitin-protein ligase peroxin 12 [Tulasnella sp. 408]